MFTSNSGSRAVHHPNGGIGTDSVDAGFLEHTDAQVGRLVATLEDLEILDDTLVFYIIGPLRGGLGLGDERSIPVDQAGGIPLGWGHETARSSRGHHLIAADERLRFAMARQ